MIMLDTHILLWILSDQDQLSEKAREMIDKQKRCISIASFWEISIKASLKDPKRRLVLGMTLDALEEQCRKSEIDILPITTVDCKRASVLEHIHDDPFDRIIIAQAMERGLPLVTRDQKIWQYADVEKIW